MSEVTILSKSAGLTTTGRTILVYNQPMQKAANIVFNGTKWAEFAKLIENHADLGVSSVSTYQAVLASSQLTLEFLIVTSLTLSVKQKELLYNK